MLKPTLYYGKLNQEDGFWVRGQAKDGTTRFYRIATVYLIVHDLRFTLGLRFVRPKDDTVTVLTSLLKQIKEFGLPIRRLLLDRGFAGIEVQEYLDQQGIPALICCPIRGKSGGTRALCKGRKGYRTDHTFKSKGRQRTAQLAVCRVFTTISRTTGSKRKATWWVFILIQLDLSPNQVRRLYRRRFGIETSYRCAGKVRGWTTSSNPAYRFSLIAIAIFLLNVWTILRWHYTQIPRRGGRLLDDKRFQLSRFANFIARALLRQYDYVRHITAVVAPLA
jgi:putative transposase